MQPLQRSYAINEDRINGMIQKGSLDNFYNANKVFELDNSLDPLTDKDKKILAKFKENESEYNRIINLLKSISSDKVFYSLDSFKKYVSSLNLDIDKKLLDKIIDGLSIMDKNAEIQKDKKGNIIYDKDTKDTEIVKWNESIDDYMKREVLPHVPDAKAFFDGDDENASFDDDFGKKNIKIGAEIPFTRYFYKYNQPENSENLAFKFEELENSLRVKISHLFGGEK